MLKYGMMRYRYIRLKDRLKELENFLDLSVLQMKQGITEGVNDF